MIGILTLSASDNCGSLLQAYALQQYLKRRLHMKSEIIDFRPKASERLYSIFPDDVIREKRRMLNALSHYRLIKAQKEDYESFRKNWLETTPCIYKTEDDLKSLKRYNKIIAGSDQVWNVRMPDFDMAYFLGWFNGEKYAYAPSAGGTPIQESTNVSAIKEDLNQFSALSAREDLCKKSVEQLTGKKVNIALDPTLLLTQEEWQETVQDRVVQGDYIFYYSWAYNSDAVNKKVAEFAEQNHLPVYVINQFKWVKHKPKDYGFKMCSNAGPQTFLSLMKYSTYALVQSFHGVIFAYQMDKKFFFLDDVPEEKMDVRLRQALMLLEKMDQVLRPEDNVQEKMVVLNNRNIETEQLRNSREYSGQYLQKVVGNI